MKKKKIYQIELISDNGAVEVRYIPYNLYSWQVFKSKENAENWAKENLTDYEKTLKMVILDYEPEDIEDYIFVEDCEY